MNIFLKRALFQKKSPFWGNLPYNFNWMLPPNDRLLKRGLKEPIVFADVGCRGGIPDELYSIAPLLHHIGFDADEKECQRLSSEPHKLRDRHVFPVFIGEGNKEIDFHLYESRGASSALAPDERYKEMIGGPSFAIEETFRVHTVTLDDFFAEHPELVRPDMLKLDTQGTELSILTGSQNCLKTCSLVEIEVEFMKMYQGQHLFHQIMEFMLDHGFELLHLNRVFSQRRKYFGFSKAQITFGDALFVRREDQLQNFDNQRMMRMAILLINYGYLDITNGLLEYGAFDAEDIAFLKSYLEKRRGRWSQWKFKRAVIPYIDKIILTLLHWRKHNSLTFDSDRSWPTR